jgi:hypothetical protein
MMRWVFVVTPILICGMLGGVEVDETETKQTGRVVQLQRLSQRHGLPGEAQTFKFSITNDWSEIFTVERIHQSCSCQVVGKLPVTLDPGKSYDFPVVVSTDPLPSDYTGTITISGKSPSGEACFIVLKTECVTQAVLNITEPDSPVSTDSDGRAAVRYSIAPGSNPFTWDAADITFSVPEYDFSFSESVARSVLSTAPGESRDIIIPLAAGTRIGTTVGTLRIDIRSADRPAYTMSRRVAIRNLRGWSVSPSTIYFGALERGGATTCDFEIAWPESVDKQLTIRKMILSDPTRIHAQAHDEVKGAASGHLVFSALDKSGPANGFVDIEMSDGTIVRMRYLAKVRD